MKSPRIPKDKDAGIPQTKTKETIIINAVFLLILKLSKSVIHKHSNEPITLETAAKNIKRKNI
ncbi:MAG: hypothetical protein RR640_04375, partial [Oscillospiraceae bacterium]